MRGIENGFQYHLITDMPNNTSRQIKIRYSTPEKINEFLKGIVTYRIGSGSLLALYWMFSPSICCSSSFVSGMMILISICSAFNIIRWALLAEGGPRDAEGSFIILISIECIFLFEQVWNGSFNGVVPYFKAFHAPDPLASLGSCIII